MKQISFDEAIELNKDETLSFFPYAFLSNKGRHRVKEFCDEFYGTSHCDDAVIINRCEIGAEQLLEGFIHNCEFSQFKDGKLLVDTILLTPKTLIGLYS